MADYDDIKNAVLEMESDVKAWEEKGNKAACRRLRVACSEIAKKLQTFRRDLLEASKK